VTSALALSAAVLWGIWSYGTGRYGRQVSHWMVILISGSVAGLVYFGTGLLSGDLAFAREDVVAGLLGGLLNLGGNVLILQAYSRGKLGVAAGVSPAQVLIPLAYSFMLGEALGAAAAIGIIVIFIGLVMFVLPGARGAGPLSGGRATVMLAVASAVFYGLAVVVLDVGTRTNLYGTLTMSEVAQVIVTCIVVLAMRSSGGLTAKAITPLAASGIALGLGSVAFYAAADSGDVGVVSVLSSLSPIVTALMAWMLLKERMSRSELLALLVVLAGTTLVVL